MIYKRQQGFISGWLWGCLLWILFAILALSILSSMVGGVFRSAVNSNSLTVNTKIGGLVIGFFNGVGVVYEDAVEHQSRLFTRFGNKASSDQPIQYQLFYNDTYGQAEDLMEAYEQRMAIIGLGERYDLFWDAAYSDGAALHRAVARIPGADSTVAGLQKDFSAKFLGNLRSMVADKKLKTSLEHRRLIESLTGRKSKVKLVLVAHSQGNLYALPAFTHASKRSKVVSVVHVAPPIDIKKGEYILSSGDAVINSLRPDHILPANVDSPTCVEDCFFGVGFGHGFTEVYFNEDRAAGRMTEKAVRAAMGLQ